MTATAPCPLCRPETEWLGKPVVYIAGPLNAPDAAGYLANVGAMIRAALAVRRAGFPAVVPCLDLLVGVASAADLEPLGYNDYFGPNQAILAKCDALYFIGHSPGTDKEIAFAHERGIPVCVTLLQLKCLKRKDGKWALPEGGVGRVLSLPNKRGGFPW